MAEIDYRPRSATEILDAAFRLLRNNYTPFVLLAAVSYFPAAVLNVYMRRVIGVAPSAVLNIGWTYFGVAILQIIIFQLMTALLSILASRAYLQEPLDPGSTWQVAVPRFVAIIMTSLLLVASCLVGFIFFIFPAIYVYTRYGLASTVAAIEGMAINESFARSSSLSQGQKLHIFGVMVLTLVVYFIIVIAITLLSALLPGLTLKTLAGFIATILVWPLLPIAQTILYYDLRIRAEAFDVEMMTRGLDSVGGPSTEPSF